MVTGSYFTSQNPLVQVFGLVNSPQLYDSVGWPDGTATPAASCAANEPVTMNYTD